MFLLKKALFAGVLIEGIGVPRSVVLLAIVPVIFTLVVTMATPRIRKID